MSSIIFKNNNIEKIKKEKNSSSKLNLSQKEDNNDDSKNYNISKIINQSSIYYQYPI